VYKGETQDGIKEGHGVLYGNDTLVEYEGEWSSDKFNGQGVLFNQEVSDSKASLDSCDLSSDTWIKYTGGFKDG
jgi:hypothetical protein